MTNNTVIEMPGVDKGLPSTTRTGRRVVQIAFDASGVLYAVADDGTLWQKCNAPPWLLVDALPERLVGPGVIEQRHRATNVKGRS